jgi:hypothetical protein
MGESRAAVAAHALTQQRVCLSLRSDQIVGPLAPNQGNGRALATNSKDVNNLCCMGLNGHALMCANASLGWQADGGTPKAQRESIVAPSGECFPVLGPKNTTPVGDTLASDRHGSCSFSEVQRSFFPRTELCVPVGLCAHLRQPGSLYKPVGGLERHIRCVDELLACPSNVVVVTGSRRSGKEGRPEQKSFTCRPEH